MAREITEQDLANKGVSGLPDVPGLTTEAMQKKFDEISKELLVPRFNEMAKEVNEVNENLDNAKKNVFYNQISVQNIDDIPTDFSAHATTTTTLGTFPNGFNKVGVMLPIRRTSNVNIQLYMDVDNNMATRVLANGTWGEWDIKASNSDLGYIDITDQFTVNSDKVRLFAYAENGMVTIDIQLIAGFNGSINIANLNNLKYAPRITAYGFYNCTGSGADKNAYLGSYIDRVGTMYVWCDKEIVGIEHVTVLYPIQRN